MMKSLFWNMWVIYNASSLKRLKKLSKIHNISFLAIMEPMVDASKLEEVRIKLKFSSAYINVTSKVWVFWQPNMQCSVISDTEQALTVKRGHDQVEGEFVITSVYAKCARKDKRGLLDEFRSVHALQLLWFLGGDFNIVRYVMKDLVADPSML